MNLCVRDPIKTKERYASRTVTHRYRAATENQYWYLIDEIT